ncbi:MAG: hypothetical protein QM736_10400 [Vicinamibacterales bacterium]
MANVSWWTLTHQRFHVTHRDALDGPPLQHTPSTSLRKKPELQVQRPGDAEVSPRTARSIQGPMATLG